MQTPSVRAEAVTRRTYNRPLDDNGDSLETWDTTVHRATVVHHTRLWEEAGGTPDSGELAELESLVLNRQALVAGRTLWLGGTEYGFSRACSQFNCSYTRAQTVYQMVDIFWLLLNGCGVGFRPNSGTLHGFLQPIKQFEVISSNNDSEFRGQTANSEVLPTAENNYTWKITVGDSARAWALSLGKLLNPPTCIVSKLVLDFSEIRGAGKRLRGYGWICNGAGPLEKAYRKIFAIMNAKAGELLHEIDLLDIVNWLGTVLSSRRAAQISLIDYQHPRWLEFATAKKEFWLHDNEHRQQSNNSIVFYHKPSKKEIRKLMRMIWDCGGSEPGFVNGAAAQQRAPWFDGLNPCVTGDTLIPTKTGLRRIESLAGMTVEIMDGNGDWVASECKQTADNAELLAVTLSDGSTHRVTPTHNFILPNKQTIKASELTVGTVLAAPTSDQFHCGSIHRPVDAYVAAWMQADGTAINDNTSKLQLYAPKYQYLNELEEAGLSFRGEERKTRRRIAIVSDYSIPDKAHIPDFVLQGTRETVISYLRGYIQSDGHYSRTDKGLIVQFTSIHKSFLQELQALCRLLNIYGCIAKNRDAGLRQLPDGKGGYKDYPCEATWRFTVSNPAALLTDIYPEMVKRGAYTKVRDSITVKSIEALPETAAVYCFGVPTTSSFALPTVMSGNCAEILLQSRGFCNLVTTAVSKFKNNFSKLSRAMYIMGRANYRQTCVNLDDGLLSPEWDQTNKALRLCGMSLTGIAQAEWLTNYQIKMLYNTAVSGAYSMATELGLPKPKLVTTIKPEGTGSKIMDVTEGIHKPLGRYIFNWINFNPNDPIVGVLETAGYQTLPHPGDENAKLICFPVEYTDCNFDSVDGKDVNIESAVSQLNKYRRWNTLWTDHNTSITVSWDISELDDIVNWLHRYWGDFVAVSWLKRNDPTKSAADLGYSYLPQDVVTADTYHAYTQKLRAVDWSKLHGVYDITMNDCDSGMCPVK